MKFLPIHTDALRSFGYTEEEARFLYLVATHSGYFTCQQFLHFIQMKPGKRSVAFAQKVIEKKHAKTKPYLRHGRVFHLFSRNLYEAIGRENVRFRRVHSTQYIRMRLIALDFVLRNQDVTYLETEEQKLTFFCDQMGIAKKILPHKRYSGAIKGQFTDRYFVDKFPMFLPVGATPPVATFSYVEPQAENLSAFVNHLQTYSPLFRGLEKFGFLFISSSDALARKAREIFSALVKGPLEQPSAMELMRYFRVRRAWENRRFAELKNEDIEFLSQATIRFKSHQCQELYRSWKNGQIAEGEAGSSIGNSNGNRQIAFETCLVKQQPFLRRTAGRTG